MKEVTKVLIFTFVLVGVYLVVSRSFVYSNVLKGATDRFSKMYSALVTGS